MRIVLHDWVEFAGNDIFQEFYLNDLLFRSEHILVEEIKTIAETEIVTFSCYTLVLRILLSKIMISEFFNRN